MPYDDRKQVIFLHVPKTGGTTITERLGITQFHSSDPAVRPSPQHLTCDLLREKIGEEKYRRYYKFAFVRNPWTRLLSSYFWRQRLPKKRPVVPFEEFVETARVAVETGKYYDHEFADHFIPQVEYTSDVDEVFRFESFSSGLADVAARLGTELGPLKDKPAEPHGGYWDYYDPGTRAVVETIYAGDIQAFGHEFGKGGQ